MRDAVATRYAKSGNVNIAYQVIGEGPLDLVFVMGWVSNLDWFWREPRFARFLRGLASFSRLILFDKRGTGLSDRVTTLPSLEQRMDDVRAVMDAAGSARAALMGVSEGGPMCALFAATYPERTQALVMFGGYARRAIADDHPWGDRPDTFRGLLNHIETDWGGTVGLAARAPSLVADTEFASWWSSYLRMSASPGAALMLTRMNELIDIREVLPSVRVPTLILHRVGDRAISVESSRYLASRIPGARLIELPGADHLPFVGDLDAVLGPIEEFLTGVRHPLAAPTSFGIVLATRLAGARRSGSVTARSDAAFNVTLDEQIARWRGREMPRDADVRVAAFDGPERAVRCALAVRAIAAQLGLDVRCGLHAGAYEESSSDGPAVRQATELTHRAGPAAIVASPAVKELLVGSGIAFDEVADASRQPLFVIAMDDPASASHSATRQRLTPREREIATLVALGLTNRQIAEHLVIAVPTAERHIANMLNKLGFRSRAQIASWATANGLIGANALEVT